MGLILAFYVGACVWTILFGSSILGYNPFCENIHRVAVYEEAAYILTTDIESNYRYYASEDFGNTWKQIREKPDVIKDVLVFPSPNPPLSEMCDPRNPQQCYRITSTSDLLEESRDAGQIWNQVHYSFRLKSSRSCQSPGPKELAFVADSKQSVLIVAMGSGGIALRSSDDQWLYYNMDDFRELLISE